MVVFQGILKFAYRQKICFDNFFQWSLIVSLVVFILRKELHLYMSLDIFMSLSHREDYLSAVLPFFSAL